MINFKVPLKLISVMILTFGAVFICTIFFNYSIDLKGIEHLIIDSQAQGVYEALTTQNQITIAAAGGILGVVTFLVLLFSITQFINESSAELGVMKALGYSHIKLSLEFAKFGLSIFIASAVGFLTAIPASHLFYNAFDSEGVLPKVIKFGFHIQVPFIMIVVPTILFSLIAVLYAMLKLKKPSLDLINGTSKIKINKLTEYLQNKGGERTFIKELKRNMLFSNYMLIFFMGFAVFGFATEIQMAFMMSEVTEGWLMPAVFIAFGIIMGLVTLLLALTFIVKKNIKYLAMLKAYGYTENECNRAMFGGYRIVTYIGFAIGTVYQYFFMKMMIGVFANAYELPEVKFPILGFFITLVIFLASYEFIMVFYKQKIAKISLRQIMQA